MVKEFLFYTAFTAHDQKSEQEIFLVCDAQRATPIDEVKVGEASVSTYNTC